MDTKRSSSGSKLVVAGALAFAVVVVLFFLLSSYAGGLGASFMDDNPRKNIVNAPGMARAGTLADPAGIWSGPVSCEWHDNPVMTTGIGYIRGLAVPINEAALVPGRDPLSGKVTDLDLGTAQGYAELSIGTRQNFDVHIAMAADGRTGTATTVGGAIIFEWNCTDGPEPAP